MQIIVKSKHMQMTPQLRERIDRKVQRLSRLVDENARIEVTVSEEQTRSANDRFSVRLAVNGSNQPIFGEVSALTATAALDLVLDKVVTQLGRLKDRQTARRNQRVPVKMLALSRAGLLTSLNEAEESEAEEQSTISPVEEEHNEAIWNQVMEIRRMPTTPMTDQEVIALMEQDGSSFYPFYNKETDSVNVMYRLDSGGYGLLVPATS